MVWKIGLCLEPCGLAHRCHRAGVVFKINGCVLTRFDMLCKGRHLWSHDTAKQKTQQARLANMSDMNKSTTICHVVVTKCEQLWGLPWDGRDKAVRTSPKFEYWWNSGSRRVNSEKGGNSHRKGIIFICFLLRLKKALMSWIKSARPVFRGLLNSTVLKSCLLTISFQTPEDGTHSRICSLRSNHHFSVSFSNWLRDEWKEEF